MLLQRRFLHQLHLGWSTKELTNIGRQYFFRHILLKENISKKVLTKGILGVVS